MPLVLEIFPGISLFGRAFEEAGFTVVRGPDPLWGGDIRGWHVPAGRFDGVIGGPPCQEFSKLAVMVRSNGHSTHFGNLIPEFERLVAEAQPAWWVMENVPGAPEPAVDGYSVQHVLLNNRWLPGDSDGIGAEQNRTRRISFGSRDGRRLVFDVALFEAPAIAAGVTSSDGGGVMRGRRPFAVTARHAARVPWVPGSDAAGHGGVNSKQYVYSLEDACELQGLPRDFCDSMPFRKEAKLKAVANAVPLPMGRAIAKAVRRAMYAEEARA